MKRLFVIAAVMALFTFAVAGAYAQTLNLYFGDSAGNQITSVNVAPGATFTAQVWYRTSDAWAHNAIDVLVGFDRTSSTGTGAVALDGRLSLVSVTNIGFPVVLANTLGGGYNSTAGDRPYGLRLALGTTLGTTVTAQAPRKVADITLRNVSVPVGSYYDMTIWNAGSGKRWTSYAPMFDTIRRPTPATLRVNSAGNLPTVGATNSTVSSALMSTAAPNYNWVLWGKVSDRNGNQFNIDDGSGVLIKVVDTSGAAVSNGDYVSVKGTLDVNSNPPTLTAQAVTKYN